MDRSSVRFLRIALTLLTAWVVSPALARAADEDDVRAAFKDFQQAIKAGDPEKIWASLDKSNHESAEKAAKSLCESYHKADAKKKAEIEKAMGLSADELAKLTGKVYTKSKRFLGKYNEVPGSKVEMKAVRQDGKWKVSPK